MIHVDFDPSALTGQLQAEWSAWQQRAEAATDAAIQAWEDWRANGSPSEFKFAFDERIWGDLKDWLIKNVFNNKCAYCETREVRSSYHAEHFRPKAKVTVKVLGKKRQQVCTAVDEMGNAGRHPGYFWLAYTWANLLPSCAYCNAALGKGSQFPIRKAHVSVTLLSSSQAAGLNCQRIMSKDPARLNIYYLQPEDLGHMEDPLLLHPYLDNPDEHLVFGEFGVVTPRDSSEKGKHSIEVYNLDSEPLTTARQIAQEQGFQDYTIQWISNKKLSHRARIAAARSSINGYVKGEEPYSAAVMATLRLEFPHHGLPDVP